MVGNPPQQGQVNSTLSALALDLRDVCGRIANFQTWLTTTGQGGLESLGFTQADAAAVLQMASYLSTVAGCYNGAVQQGGQGGTGAIEFDFDNALSAVWAGQ